MSCSLPPQLLMALTDPVVWLGQDGRVKQANPSARRQLPGWLLEEAGQAWYQACRNEDLGDPPSKFPNDRLPVPDLGWEIWRIHEDGDGAIFLFSASPYDAPQDTARVASIMLLAGTEFRHEMVALSALLRDTFGKFLDATSVKDHALLMGKAKHLWEQLEGLATLSEMYAQHAMDPDERIDLYSLVQRLVAELRASGGQGARWVIQPGGHSVAPVYGNAKWLGMALTAYLMRLVQAVGPDGEIQIEIRQMGGYAILSGRCTGESVSEHQDGGARPGRQAGNPELAFLIASRILSLHGAETRVRKQTGTKNVEAFVITLPTSLPQGRRPDVWCQECPAMSQSLIFAKEIANLWSEKDKHAD